MIGAIIRGIRRTLFDISTTQNGASLEDFIVNVSAIQDYMSCPFRWWCKWVANRVPREEALALSFGKLLHQVFEDHANGLSMDESLILNTNLWHQSATEATDPLERDVRLKAIKQLAELIEPLSMWVDQYPIQQTLEVEEPFEVTFHDHPGFRFRGRPDRVVVMSDLVWHDQTKGLARSTNFAVFTELAKRSYHEHLYAHHLSRKYNEFEYGGTLFNLIRKLKYRTKDGKVKNLQEMFWQFPMSIDVCSVKHDEILSCIIRYAHEMRKAQLLWELEGLTPLPNERMNGGFYGNKPDIYFKVLTNEIKLDDDRYFKDREDTYADAIFDTPELE